MEIVKQSVEVISGVNGTDILKRLEKAGRTCYMSESENTIDSAILFVKRIIASGHESVLEHESISVRIITDRAIANELVRHRLASYSQESTRYVAPDNLQVIEPTGLVGKAREIWLEGVECAEEYYNELRELGVQKQIARSVLPLCTKTEIVMTANIREWRHILKLRTDQAAHPDMQNLAYEILRKFKAHYPALFDDITDD